MTSIRTYSTDTYTRWKLESNHLKPLEIWCWRRALKTVDERRILFDTNGESRTNVVWSYTTPVSILFTTLIERIKWLSSETKRMEAYLWFQETKKKSNNNRYTEGISNMQSLTYSFASVLGSFGKNTCHNILPEKMAYDGEVEMLSLIHIFQYKLLILKL